MHTRPELIAHRGAPREQVENTLPSIAVALAQGADAIELDVHFTRDRVAVVHHDGVIGAGATRHTGEPIDALDASAVTGIELAPGVTIPSLRDVCAAVAGRATLYVELKSAATDAELAAVHDLLVRAARLGPGCVALHGFDHALVRRAGALEPRIRTGILREADTADPVAALRKADACDLWQHWSEIDPPLVAAVHRAGARVIAWTVNDPEDARRLAGCGVDGLCTDDVPLVRAALAL